MALQFKTTINCGNCVRTVTPHLNELVGADGWSVDTTVADKILTVNDDSLSSASVVELIEDLGFDAELL